LAASKAEAFGIPMAYGGQDYQKHITKQLVPSGSKRQVKHKFNGVYVSALRQIKIYLDHKAYESHSE